MKRKLCTLLILVLYFVVGVCADVIYEPMDPFYMENRDNCTRVEKYYTVNSPLGYVNVYDAPGSDVVVRQLQNGKTVYVSYCYAGSWGISDDYDSDQSGWFPMEYLDPAYDEEDFLNDNAHRIEEKIGCLNVMYMGKEIIFWEYPGSSRILTTYELGTDWTGDVDLSIPFYTQLFEDDQGRRWGYVPYFEHEEGWLCLDDPTADFESLYEQSAEQGIDPMLWVLTIGVSVVIGVTIGLLIVMKTKEE